MPNTPEPSVKRRGGYPGRDELNQAIDAFRRHVARLHREGARHKDPEIPRKVAEIVRQAVADLERLTGAAMMAERDSLRHREAAAVERAKLERTARRAGPRGAGVVLRLERPRDGD